MSRPSPPPIRFGREKRLLLGTLALVAPLPLPFNGVVAWPVLIGYVVALAAFLARASKGEKEWLPNWALNLLGLAYMPVLFGDFSIFWRGQLLRPLVHLALFALAVKLFAVSRERDKSHALVGIFFLTLAAAGSSVHPSMLVYLVAMLVLFVLVLMRFAALHAVAAFGVEQSSTVRPPIRGFIAMTTLLVIVGAIPVFIVLPRIRSPYIVARAPTGTTLATNAGFSNEVGLDAIGRLRTSRTVALRFARERPSAQEVRFKAATYDEYSDSTWRRSPGAPEPLRRGRDGFFRLSDKRAREKMQIWRSSLGSTELPTPVEAVTLSVPVTSLRIDRGGAVALAFPPSGSVEYEVGIGTESLSAALSPEERGEGLGDSAVTDAMRQLAVEAMGEGEIGERIARLEGYLASEYSYTLDFLGRGGADPISDFLFRNRRGHCELFASAMVLMLRAEGIPARFVTGFLGAEFNPLEGYWLVRQSNRHAWVEAWLPEEGWRIYDPTPAAGRPQAADDSLTRRLGQAWDYMVFRWDRYVLTYGVNDQLDLVVTLRDLWRSIFGRFETPQLPSFDSGEKSPKADEETADPDGLESPLRRLDWVPIAVLLMLVVAWAWIRRPELTATRAYLRLRARLARAGLPVGSTTPPLEVHRQMSARYPETDQPGGRVIRFYLRESFGAERLSAEEHKALVASYRETLKRARSA